MSNLPKWKISFKSHIWIFNVERGLCVFIRTPLNYGIMYDFGSSDNFKPPEFLKKHILPYISDYSQKIPFGEASGKIAQSFISHPHADHISEIECLLSPSKKTSPFNPALHTCPHDKKEKTEKPEAINWDRIKNPKGSEVKIENYKKMYEERIPPLQTLCYNEKMSIPNLEYGLYYVRSPKVEEIFPNNDQEYGNGLSFVFYYRHGIHTILFPGDINPDTFNYILDEKEGFEKRFTTFDAETSRKHNDWYYRTSNQPSLKSLLSAFGLSILVAPHHGLESGYSEDLYNAIKNKKPGLVVISEKRHLSEKDGKVDQRYQDKDGSIGQNVKIEQKPEFRNSVSTRDGHHILILFQGTGGLPEVYLEKNPVTLLEHLK